MKSSLALYNSTLTQVLDQHAPLKRKFVPNCRWVPWFSECISDEIRKHWQVTGTYLEARTKPIRINILIFIANADWSQTFYFHLRRNTTLIFSMNTGGIPNRCLRYVIAYLAKAKTHHLLLVSWTKNLQTILMIFFTTKINNIRSKFIEQNLGSPDITDWTSHNS